MGETLREMIYWFLIFLISKNRWDSIRMDVMQYYVKRCIALPGDTLEIRGGFYKIRGCNEQVGNYQAQQYIANLQHPKQHGIVFGTFPYNKQLKWNIREFGPLPVPQKGHVVEMDRTTYHLYKQLIGWEQKEEIASERRTGVIGRQSDFSISF